MDTKWGTFLLKVLHGLLRRAYSDVKADDDDVDAAIVVKQQWFELLDRFPRMDAVTRYVTMHFLNAHYPPDVEFVVPPSALATFAPVLDAFVAGFHDAEGYWSLPVRDKLAALDKHLNRALRKVVVPVVAVVPREGDATDQPDPDAECPPFREIELDGYHPVNPNPAPPEPPAKPSPSPAAKPAPKPGRDRAVKKGDPDSDDEFVPAGADLSQFSRA